MKDVFGEYEVILGVNLNCCPNCGAPVECRAHYSDVMRRYRYAIICTKECTNSRTSYDTIKKAERAHNKQENWYTQKVEMAKLKRENAHLRKQLAKLKENT